MRYRHFPKKSLKILRGSLLSIFLCQKYFMKYLVLILALTINGAINAQQLYQPRSIKETYEKGTRSMDGRPGKNYWENHARYDMTLTVMPPDRTIRGKEKIVYTNNSPDTLKYLIIKLFLNIHKPGAPRDQGATEDYLTSGVHIDHFTQNGQQEQWRNYPDLFTWNPVGLETPLLPHDSITLTFDWHYEISLKSNREGMIDSTTYYLAYFYPRVAVYDDYNGWDMMDFMEDKEFYSDFNDYRVTLNVPRNFIVWGTGTLENPGDVLQPAIESRYLQSFHSDSTIHVITPEDIKNKDATSRNEVNSWEFTAMNIADVAFGISDHYDWDACSAVVDATTGRRACANAAFNDTAADFHQMAQFARHSLAWLSSNWPGVAYPYEKTTVFQGYAGMEYPMMVNDQTYQDTDFSRFVAEHEISHTYMPFYMGINETRYGFMDEGWATTFEYLIGTSDMGKEREDALYKKFRVEDWISNPSPDEDLPITTPGDVLTGEGLGNNEYGKASLGYLAMKDLLGDALFKKCLHAYMDRWHGKHPIPWDFFYTYDDVSGKDLNWFWKSWFFSHNYIDLSIRKVEKTHKGYSLTIQNIGGMPAPVDVIVDYSDGTSDTLHQSPAIWQKDLREAHLEITATKKVQSITLDGGIFMDANPADNYWKIH